MNIYIAYNYNNEPLGVLLSDSKEKAEIAWAGMGTPVHHVEEIDPKTAKGIHGVIFLLTTQEANSRRDYGHRLEGVNFNIWKRGL